MNDGLKVKRDLEQLTREVKDFKLDVILSNNEKWYLIKDSYSTVAMLHVDLNNFVLVNLQYKEKLKELMKKYSR